MLIVMIVIVCLGAAAVSGLLLKKTALAGVVVFPAVRLQCWVGEHLQFLSVGSGGQAAFYVGCSTTGWMLGTSGYWVGLHPSLHPELRVLPAFFVACGWYLPAFSGQDLLSYAILHPAL